MKSKSHEVRRSKRGTATVMAVLMLAAAGVTAGIILSSTVTHGIISEKAHCHDTAAFLADAGMQAAMVKLNYQSDGNITYSGSRSYFSSSNNLTASDWGFQTTVVVTNGGQYLVKSTGQYNSHQVQVQAQVTLGWGNRTVHAIYAHALFAGNSSGDTNYILKIGGTNPSADFVMGDVYSGRKLDRSGDAKLRLPEILNVDRFVCHRDVHQSALPDRVQYVLE